MSYQYHGFTRAVAVWCACLLLLPVGFVPMLEGAQDSAGRIKQLVEALGSGAEVNVTPSYGNAEIRGVIRDIAEDQFALDPGRGRPARHFTYGQVRKLTFARMTYRASGETDVAAVKRVLNVVGLGKYVLVKTRDSRKVRGRIETIGQDQFTLLTGGSSLTGRSTRSLQIAYQQVGEVKPKPLSSTAKAVIISGASVGAGILGAFLIYMGMYEG